MQDERPDKPTAIRINKDSEAEATDDHDGMIGPGISGEARQDGAVDRHDVAIGLLQFASQPPAHRT